MKRFTVMVAGLIRATLVIGLSANISEGNPFQKPQLGISFTENVAGIKIKMVAVWGGTFTMGCTFE